MPSALCGGRQTTTGSVGPEIVRSAGAIRCLCNRRISSASACSGSTEVSADRFARRGHDSSGRRSSVLHLWRVRGGCGRRSPSEIFCARVP